MFSVPQTNSIPSVRKAASVFDICGGCNRLGFAVSAMSEGLDVLMPSATKAAALKMKGRKNNIRK